MGKVKELNNISLATTYEIDNSFDSDKFIKMRLRVCHDKVNPNKSNFEVEDMEKASDSIQNIPILANVIFDENGQPQFGGHDMEIEEDKTKQGEYRLIYKEVPIGVVPQNCNHTIEKFNDKNYVFVDGYVWKEYSNYAQDIIERDKDVKLSMEIIVDGYSYNAKDKVYNITDYRYQGITFLNKDFGTGMENALATTETFEENDSKEKFIMMAEELKNALADYNINKIEEGGRTVNEEIVALLSQYNITADQLTFSIDGMSVEEVEQKLKEEFNIDNGSEKKEEEIKNEPEKFIKSFELSHEDIRYALYQLLSPVESEDNEWYFIDHVYDGKFEYVNWEGTKIYRQGYKKEEENVSFEGDRIELFQERLTEGEKEILDKMRSNYSTLEEEVKTLRDYQATKFEEERKEAEEILFSQFKDLEGNEEFEDLKKNASKHTIEQLEKEVAFIMVKNATNIKFSAKSTPKKDKVKIDLSKSEETENTEEPYGGLFTKYLTNND